MGATSLVNVTVSDGTVDVWGIVDSPPEKQALRVAVEMTPGVRAVNDNRDRAPDLAAPNALSGAWEPAYRQKIPPSTLHREGEGATRTSSASRAK